MSSFDIGSLVLSLQSNKIKQRNEALNSLESYVQTPIKLLPKQFKILIFSIFDLIVIESNIYKLKPSIAIENRLVSAASYVKIIVEKSINSISLKSKGLIEIIKCIIGLTFVDNNILLPCSVDFLITINNILKLGFVKDHLNLVDYNNFAQFFIKIINQCIDSFELEKLLTCTFESLHNLLQCGQLMSTNYLQMYQIYLPLLPLIRKTCLHYTRENIIILFCFRIINKLIIVLSTEDIVTANGFIQVGVDILLAFYSSNWNKLYDQFLIFLNLDQVHDFFDISDLTDHSNFRDKADFDSDGLFLYKTSALAQNLISRFNTNEFELSYNDLRSTDYNSKISWFALKTCALSSPDYKAWLFGLGLAKLLNTYFNLKGKHKPSTDNILGFNSPSSLKFSSPQLKRQKLGTIADSLHSASNTLDFCNRLISESSDPKIQNIGLKVLIFHLQWYPVNQTETDLNPQENSDCEGSSDHSNFTFTVSSSNTIDKNLLVKNVLATFENTELNIWTMLASESILIDNLIANRYICNRSVYQLLSIAILNLKDSSMSQVACRLANLVLLFINRYDLHNIIDKPMITQIENLIDLSELHGPYKINNDSIYLWYSIYNIIQKRNVKSKQLMFAEKVQEWFLRKLLGRSLEFHNLLKLSEFIAWLCGVQVFPLKTIQKLPTKAYIYPISEPFHFMGDRLPFESFLELKDTEESPGLDLCIQSDNLIQSKDNETFLLAVLNLFSMYLLSSSNYIEEFQNAIVLTSLSIYFKEQTGLDHFSNSMEQKSIFYFNSLEDSLLLAEQKLDIVKDYNFAYLMLDHGARQLIEKYVHFDVFCNDILKLFQVENQENGKVSTSMFDDDLETEQVGENEVEGGFSLSNSSDFSIQTLDCMFNCGLLSNIIPTIIAHLERFSLNISITTIGYLVDRLMKINIVTISTTSLNLLVRFVGVNILTDHKLERSELVIVAVCRLLRVLIPIFIGSIDHEFRKDCYDMCKWLVECDAQKLVTTEYANLETCKFHLAFILYNDESVISNEKLKPLFFARIRSSSNYIRTGLVKDINKLLSRLPKYGQIEFYSKLLQDYPSPDISIEASASFAYCFSIVGKSSSHILNLAVFNLLECFKFPNFMKYLKVALESICASLGLINTTDLFKSMKLTLLKWWWENDSYVSFPFALFGYKNKEDFYRDNYRELIAIVLSLSRNHSDDNNLLTEIVETRNSDIPTICNESLSLAIPLSFTHQGKKSEIFTDLITYLGAKYKQDFQEKLLLIVLEILNLTDVSREDVTRDLFKDVPIATELLSKNSSNFRESTQLAISPSTSKELLTKLIKKYYPDADFWNIRNVYFLLRRILIRSHNGILSSERSSCIKRLKLVLILGSQCVENIEIIQLLIRTLCQLYCYPELHEDICLILSVLPIDSMLDFTIQRSLPLVFEMLSAFLGSDEKVRSKGLLLKLQNYVDLVGPSSKVYPILLASIHMLKGEPQSCTSKEIENFLLDQDLLGSSRIGKSNDKILGVLSRLFPNVITSESMGLSEIVIKLLLETPRNNYSQYSREFQLWASKYLADFYLSGELFSEGCQVTSFKEFVDLDPKYFESRIKSMDSFLDVMLSYCDDNDFDIVAASESILGVLLFKYSVSKSEVLKFINFEPYYERFQGFITPIDFHSCVMLNDDPYMEYLGVSTEDILLHFNDFISSPFELWTTRLLLALLQDIAVYTSIAPLFSNFAIRVKAFAKTILPYFVSYYVQLRKGKGKQVIADLMSCFTKSSSKDESAIELFTRILLLIRVGAKNRVQHFDELIRLIDLRQFYEVTSNNKLSKTAILLFEEIHCEDYRSLDWQSESKLLSSVYESIDDQDIIYGIPERPSVEYALTMMNRGNHTENQLKFNSALFDADIVLNSRRSNANILSSLSNNGLNGVSRLVNQTVGGISEGARFEWAWKLNRWDIPSPLEAKSEQEVIYKTLKQIHDFPSKILDTYESSILSTFCLKTDLMDRTMSCKEHSEHLIGWFRTLAIVQGLGDVMSYEESTMRPLLNRFLKVTSWFDNSDIAYSENIIQTRQSLFQILSSFPKDKCKLDGESVWLGALHELVRYNISSRRSNQLQGVVSSSILISEICEQKFSLNKSIGEEVKKLSQYEVANSIWSLGVTDIPVVMLKDLVAKGGIQLPFDNLSIDSALISATLVGWLATSRQDLAANIMEKYVLPTADAVESIGDVKQSAKVYHLLANFCEKQYKSRNLGEEIDKLEKRVNSKKIEIEDLKSHYGKTSVSAEEKKHVQRFYSKLKSQYNSEVLDLQSSKENKERFSRKAAQFYLKAISILEDDDEDEDEDMDKFFALWLELSSNDELNKKLGDLILALPSYKLISWSTQLISRLAEDDSEFQRILQKLVFKMCTDHPFHTLYQLLSLKLHMDYVDSNSDDYNNSKYSVANNLWLKLLNKSSNTTKKLLVPIERFCHEACKLSEHKVQKGKSLQLSRLNVGHFWLDELPKIPAPTMAIPVQKSANYDRVPVMVNVENKVIIATSGLSLPKILTFQLSDGQEHRMLVKYGADDLRQDSIMEQVFEKVNQMLTKNKETRQRKLRIRTYKAVPMGPKSGMIEFVANSVSFIDVVKPYHNQHDSMTLEKARQMMRECQSGEKSQRYKCYEEITTKINPVLRYFYFDTFLTPDSWFDSRITYTHGIATTSIVGHMLGLGDRHCNNILLDKQTGEPIHIDLGVAFDQGKRLPIPETVPFRLTRDIVDGFGVNGVNGTFTKSCQYTFKVLRKNSDHILSILDVLRWDPLYSWTITTMKKRRLQDETGGLGNIAEDGSEAGRAVVTVSDKLNAGGLSVEAAVTELIQEATNPHNLALIYLGWCPFY